jgi:hypothetical protein
MKKKLILSLMAASALACGNGRYEIIATAQESGCHAYRLDTRTGEVLCIAKIKSIPVEPLQPKPTK